MAKLLKYPFSKNNGELLRWCNSYEERESAIGETATGKLVKDIMWKENYILTEILKFYGASRGRSAVTFIWQGINGLYYPMFIKDLAFLLMHGTISNGFASHSMWTFVKRGSNYGITLVQ